MDEILAAELSQDPLHAGYATMSDIDAANVLNARTRFVYDEASLASVCRALIVMSDSNGRFVWDNIRDAAESKEHPGHDLARRLLFLFEGNLPINWGGASADYLLTMSVEAGFFTPVQAQELKDTGKRVVSRAEELGLSWIYPGDIARVREKRVGE